LISRQQLKNAKKLFRKFVSIFRLVGTPNADFDVNLLTVKKPAHKQAF